MPDNGLKQGLTIVIFVVLIVIFASGAANTGPVTVPTIIVSS